ncbi:hypothetical protein Tco_1062729 [Tanacetum coccineum]
MAGVLHQYLAGLTLVDRYHHLMLMTLMSVLFANESCSSGKLSRKGKSVRCGKCGNVGHNRKGCRGQGGATQAAGARTVSGQGCARRTVGARNVSGNASSQHSAAPSTASQGPTQHSAGLRQGFQAPRPGFPTQRLTKAIASRYSPRKLPS